MPLPDVRFEAAWNYDDAVRRAASESGIDREYWDIFHRKHEASLEAQRRLLEARGWDISTFESMEAGRRARFDRRFTAVLPPTAVIRSEEKWVPITVSAQAGTVHYEVLLENGETIAGAFELAQMQCVRVVHRDNHQWWTYRLELPAEAPLGYHTLQVTLNSGAAHECYLIVCPDRAYQPERLAGGGKLAGFNVALYGLRSDRNWGCGDFTDLTALISWARHDVGFSFIGLNPLHALHNRAPYNTSPYLPLSVYYKNFIYLDIERVPEFADSRFAQCLLGSRRQQERISGLRDAEFVQYEEVDRLKRRFLKILYRNFRLGRAAKPVRAKAFVAYCEHEGKLLDRFALYCALDEVLHKQARNCWTWRDWPMEYHSPDSTASRQFSTDHARLIEFYKYIQFVIDEQLATVQQYAKEQGMEIGLYHDLAVATDSCGSDLWAHRDFYVSGCRVGVP